MSIALLRIATVLYAGAALAYVAYFARQRHARFATLGYWLLAVGFVFQAVSIGLGCRQYGGTEFFSLRGGFFTIAWMAAGAYLLLQRAYHIPAVGAFVTPLLLLAVVPALFGEPGRPGIPPETLSNKSLTVHILTAALGDVLFGLAFAVATMYLLQEREVKGKHFGALFSRLPSLDALDRLCQRLVRAGFVSYTIAILAGTMIASAVWKSAWSWDPRQVVSLAVWLLYGAIVQLRHTGWHGRRYAVLAVVGFVVVIGSMVSLQVIPGATRHTGTYQASEVSQ